MPDGAHQGVGAERALRTILGGEPQPKDTDEERMAPEQMRAFLLSAQRGTYGGEAAWFGGIVLKWMEAHPQFQRVPAKGKSGWDDLKTGEGYHIIYPGIDDLMRLTGDWPEDADLTGFMYGWAVNAARYALGIPPCANPALLTL